MSYEPGDLRQVFDDLVDGAAKAIRLWRIAELKREADATDKRVCGNCTRWMKSSECPHEHNVRGYNRGPSMNGLPCHLFNLEPWVRELKEQRLREVAVLIAAEEGAGQIHDLCYTPDRPEGSNMSQEQIDAIKVHDDCRIHGFFNEYRWLSNFHLCPVVYEGVEYPSSENAYQAAKFPQDQREKFRTSTPKQAKKDGRSPLSQERLAWWENNKALVMLEITLDKYRRNEELKQALLATGDRHLEETNWWNDKYWGVCDGEGLNMLGKCLMMVRQVLSPVGDTLIHYSLIHYFQPK